MNSVIRNSTHSSVRSFPRRTLLWAAASAIGLVGCGTTLFQGGTKRPIAKAFPLIYPKSIWTADSLLNFLLYLPPDDIVQLKFTLGLLKPKSTENGVTLFDIEEGKSRLKGSPADQHEIRKAFCESASYFRICRAPDQVDYHALALQCAIDVGASPSSLQSMSTFQVEKIFVTIFMAQMAGEFDSRWAQLSKEQRMMVLSRADPSGKIEDRVALSLLSGVAVRAALAATVYVAGFGFYTAMTATMAAVAGLVGVTLPMSAYLAATTLIGILTGPVGMAAILISSIAGGIYLGRPDKARVATFVLQIHVLKLEAAMAEGVSEATLLN